MYLRVLKHQDMKHEIFTIKCCDSIAPFSNYGDEKYTETNDCLPRSVKVSQMIDSEMNFGMVFYYDPTRSLGFSDSFGDWNFMYNFHLWNEKGNNLYESCRQWESLFKIQLRTDELVMMFDVSHFQKPKTKNDYKTHCKEIRKRLNFAQKKNFNYVYLCGTSLQMLDYPKFRWYDWSRVDEEIDYAEKKVLNFENNLVTS